MATPEQPHPLVSALAAARKAEAPPGEPEIPAGSPEAMARATSLPELIIFAGYTGPLIPEPTVERPWQLFYLDPRMFRWMLVDRDLVRHVTRISDPRSPSGDCDYMWVDGDARVGSGSGAKPVEAPFLSGEFTRARDFEAPVGGGMSTAATGFFCEARTPFCCRRYSRT